MKHADGPCRSCSDNEIGETPDGRVPSACRSSSETGSPSDIARLAAGLLERAATSDDPAILIEAAKALLATVGRPADAADQDGDAAEAAAG